MSLDAAQKAILTGGTLTANAMPRLTSKKAVLCLMAHQQNVIATAILIVLLHIHTAKTFILLQ